MTTTPERPDPDQTDPDQTDPDRPDLDEPEKTTEGDDGDPAGAQTPDDRAGRHRR